MHLWHGTADAPRTVLAGRRLGLRVGTWPVAPGQSVTVEWQATARGGAEASGEAAALWCENLGPNSYWHAVLGPFPGGAEVRYQVLGQDGIEPRALPWETAVIGGPVHLALIWHQHQPLYRAPFARSAPLPWVRLHALRDYYGMAALLAEHPEVHATINLTPVLLEQIEAYGTGAASDRALDLTQRAAGSLSRAEREEVLGSFFDADWHRQVYPHARYKELLTQRLQGAAFTHQDLRDLQMWANLAWFGREFRDSPVRLVTGETVDVHRFVVQERDFTRAQLIEMVDAQLAVLRGVIPMHRALAQRGQVELSTSPYYHPILPLLCDSDAGTIDLPDATRPSRFAYPEDATSQVQLGVAEHARWFGARPDGCWPPEGAVSAAAVHAIGAAGLRWLASDEAVLARSGRWGYRIQEPAVLARPYRHDLSDTSVALLFRDARLSDAIGFEAQHDTPEHAAAAIVRDLRDRYGSAPPGEDRLVTVILDGENAWGAHAGDGRDFLRSLYRLLATADDIVTVTPAEYLDGNPDRGVRPHPVSDCERLEPLWPGSWIDEPGSAVGPDFGTWIGEPEENAAWELLRAAREALAGAAPPAATRDAFRCMYAAEGSDWFWWLGGDHPCGDDAVFEDLFRRHVRGVYMALQLPPPRAVRRHLGRHPVTWSYTAPTNSIQPGERLAVVTYCPGTLRWRVDDGPEEELPVFPASGALAATARFRLVLGPFTPDARQLAFRFLCGHRECDGRGPCCTAGEQTVQIEAP